MLDRAFETIDAAGPQRVEDLSGEYVLSEGDALISLGQPCRRSLAGCQSRVAYLGTP